MKYRFGLIVPPCILAAMLSLAGTATAVAQNQSATASHTPPKVLEVITEYLKPGQQGGPHMKSESVFAQAMRDAKWPTHYIGADALTGQTRAVFFVGYDSFADWQKDVDATMANKDLSGKLDKATVDDGALLSEVMTSAYVYRPELSLRPDLDISQMRYLDITIFHVKSGHERDFENVAKMFASGFNKVADVHWTTFQKMYGKDSGSIFIIVTPMKALAEVDSGMMNDKKLADAVGPDQLQKMMDAGNAAIESSEANLYAFNPKMSYVADDWDPSFWGQK
jgi:hypothetical protein